MAMSCKTAFVGKALVHGRSRPARPMRAVAAQAVASRPLWAPGVIAPEHLNGTLPGDYGWDPLCLGSEPKALAWYRQAELMHARWAMLGVAGVLVQEVVRPDVWWYEAGLPKNLPALNFGGDGSEVHLSGILAVEFLLMHFVELRRWQDIKNPGCVDEDPIFTGRGNKVSNPETGYPGFDPLKLGAGAGFKELQVKEIKNGRLAMVAFMGFTLQAQATGKGPLANLVDHLSSPGAQNWTQNIGTCHVPRSVDVNGINVPLVCLWPGQQL